MFKRERSSRVRRLPLRGPAVLDIGIALSGCGPAGDTGNAHDIVIRGARVMDPESGLDGVRDVGVRDGRIAAISEARLEGARVIDASGLVLAPGFIDLHEHGQTEEAYRL